MPARWRGCKFSKRHPKVEREGMDVTVPMDERQGLRWRITEACSGGLRVDQTRNRATGMGRDHKKSTSLLQPGSTPIFCNLPIISYYQPIMEGVNTLISTELLGSIHFFKTLHP